MQRPPVVFESTKAWAVSYLSTALAARAESFAADVAVRTDVPAGSSQDPWPASGRVVQVRDDGGARSPDVRKTVSLSFNVFAPVDADAEDLAALVAALLERSPGDGPVVAHLGSFGPYEVADESGRPCYYLSVDLSVRGVPL